MNGHRGGASCRHRTRLTGQLAFIPWRGTISTDGLTDYLILALLHGMLRNAELRPAEASLNPEGLD